MKRFLSATAVVLLTILVSTGCAFPLVMAANIAAGTLGGKAIAESHANTCAAIARQAKADKADDIETTRRLSSNNCAATSTANAAQPSVQDTRVQLQSNPPTSSVTTVTQVSSSARAMPIREVQRRLASIDYKVGTPDGVSGKRTVEAIKKFQIDFGLPPTGNVDEATSSRLLEETKKFVAD